MAQLQRFKGNGEKLETLHSRKINSSSSSVRSDSKKLQLTADSVAAGGLGDRVEEPAAVAARAVHESDDSDRVHHLAVRNLKITN